MSKKISRREFVGRVSKSVVGAGALLSGGRALGADEAPKSRVVAVTHPTVVGPDRKVDEAKVREMVRRGMRELAGVEKPFQSLFGPADRVGLKINCLGRPRLYTHHELVRAFARELEEAGVLPQNIVVWDRFEKHMTDCGFVMNRSGKGTAVLATECEAEANNLHDLKASYVSAGDVAEKRDGTSTASRLSKLFTERCNKQINLAILKDHGLSGVTLCLKNIAYGVCTNNRRFHGPKEITPFIANFCTRPDIKQKFVLHVLDGLEGCYDEGPCPGSEEVIFRPQTLWMGTDPVAIDVLGAAVIEARRKEAGLKSLKEVGRPPLHIELAAKLGVGIADPQRLAVSRLTLT